MNQSTASIDTTGTQESTLFALSANDLSVSGDLVVGDDVSIHSRTSAREGSKSETSSVPKTVPVQAVTFQLDESETPSLKSNSSERVGVNGDPDKTTAARRKSSLHGRSSSVNNLSAVAHANGLPHTASDLAPLTKCISTANSPRENSSAPLKSTATDAKRVQSEDNATRKAPQEKDGLDNFIDSFKKFSGGFNSTWNKITQGHPKTPEAMRVMRERRNEDVAAQIKKWDALLPNLDARKNERYVVDMVLLGVPGSARERIWKKGLGNYLQVTPVLYEAFQTHAQERVTALKDIPSDEESAEPTVKAIGNEASLKQIHLDLNRTFPLLDFFRTGGPYHGSLRRLLETFVCYRPDVGYVQGMSFLACMLLLNMEEADAFVCFTNLLNRPLLTAFYQMEPSKSQPYIDAFAYTFRNHLPRLYQHLRSLHVSHHMFIHEWLLTCFSKSCPLDTATRLWDGFTIYGDVFLIRAAVGILSLYSKQLLTYEFDEVALFLTKLPQDMDPDALIHHIRRVDLSATRLASLLVMFKVPAK